MGRLVNVLIAFCAASLMYYMVGVEAPHGVPPETRIVNAITQIGQHIKTHAGLAPPKLPVPIKPFPVNIRRPVSFNQLLQLQKFGYNPKNRMRAIAVLRGPGKTNGVIHLEQIKNGPVLIFGVIHNMPRKGKFGFHFHNFPIHGGCESAGEHYNPEGNDHGGQHDENRHLGDLGNIVAHFHGSAHVTLTDRKISLYGANSVLGRSLVVHTNQDDLGRGRGAESRETGRSGGRLACGTVILDGQHR